MGFTACLREEIVPYTNAGKSKIVVLGFITTGDKVNIYVGKSMPFGLPSYSPSDFEVKNAVVNIANENGLAQTLNLASATSSIYFCSQSDFAIMPGKTYTLKVNVPGYNETVASTTVPAIAAKWKTATLSKQDEIYYLFSGTWNAPQNNADNEFGVSIITPNKNIIDRTNEGITQLNTLYSVKREVFLNNTNSVQAMLLTTDKAFNNFTRKADLTLNVIENLNSAAFTDIISGFKGVIPDAGNIKGGIGVFGSYLKVVKTLNK